MATRLFAIARSLVVSTLFVSIWTYFMPRWFARSNGVSLDPHWNAGSVILLIVGGLVMGKCVWDFAWTGRGTPAPFDPPRRLVVTGLYRFVRNPMYCGMGLVLLGEALLWPQIARPLLILFATLWALVTGFIMVYEEPTLRSSFGEDYLEYCRHVRRWIPRLTPFDNRRNAAVPSPDLG